MAHDHWREYHKRWAKLGPPLRPSDEVVDAVRAELRERSGPTLLLGVTPELADVASSVDAVDRSEGMIGAIWPGDTPHRRVVQGDWRRLPFERAAFVAAVGDGSLNALVHGDYGQVGDELVRVLRPRGRFVVRAFVRPEPCESLTTVVEDARSGSIGSFHAFKWRLAMARVAELGTPDIPVTEILATFEAHFADRAALARAAGFSAADIDTIDVYRRSAETYSFPSETEIRTSLGRVFAAVRLRPVGTYPLAARCPLVIADLGD